MRNSAGPPFLSALSLNSAWIAVCSQCCENYFSLLGTFDHEIRLLLESYWLENAASFAKVAIAVGVQTLLFRETKKWSRLLL